MKDVSVISGKTVASYISLMQRLYRKLLIETAGKDTIRATAQGESIVRLSGWERPVILSRVIHVPYFEHRLVSV